MDAMGILLVAAGSPLDRTANKNHGRIPRRLRQHSARTMAGMMAGCARSFFCKDTLMLRNLSKTCAKWGFALSHRSCIAGTAIAVMLTISPPSIDFGGGRPGASSFRVLRMSNSSAAQPAVIQRIEVSPPFGIAANSCLGQLDPAVKVDSKPRSR